MVSYPAVGEPLYKASPQSFLINESPTAVALKGCKRLCICVHIIHIGIHRIYGLLLQTSTAVVMEVSCY